MEKIYTGTAGWQVPKKHAGHFPAGGSHLERYSRILPAVEINTSFYRLHRPETYRRWAESTPPDFRFSVKIPREITHFKRLKDPALLDEFFSGVSQLGKKLGPLLVQLPPSLRFQPSIAAAFFTTMRALFGGGIVCEPRHPSWFTPEAEEQLNKFRIARVAADPAVVPLAAEPGGWPGLVYYRLHGSPQVYHSAYATETLEALAQRLKELSRRGAPAWCIFDNTAEGHAVENARTLDRQLD